MDFTEDKVPCAYLNKILFEKMDVIGDFKNLLYGKVDLSMIKKDKRGNSNKSFLPVCADYTLIKNLIFALSDDSQTISIKFLDNLFSEVSMKQKIYELT